MKQVGNAYAASQKKKAKREWHWCRRHNGFSDMPIWKLVARRSGTSLVAVLAFVNRLEELANGAGNIEGRERGSVETFDADEFALALDIATDEAARIFAALEDERVNWIAFDHLVTFYDRNKDREEDAESVRDRKRRSRTYKRIREQLGRLVRLGKATADQCLAVEVTLKGISDAELVSLQNELARAELSTDGFRSQRSQSDSVTVTPEERTNSEQMRSSAVDNPPSGDRGASGGPPTVEAAESEDPFQLATRWIDERGVALLVEALTIRTQLAQTHVERWRRDVQDDRALAAIMQAAEARGHLGARLHVVIAEGVQRFLRERSDGPMLAMGPVRPGSQPKGPATDRCHDVTPVLVDKFGKRSAS